jgi:hypothetical protein
VQDREITEKNNDLIKLIHELAHLRFELYLRDNYSAIFSRAPKSLVKKNENGQWVVNSQFIEMLHEKYAFETEYSFLNYAKGVSFSLSNLKWDKINQLSPDLNISIGSYLKIVYKFTQPEVLALIKLPLLELIRGGPELDEVIEAYMLFDLKYNFSSDKNEKALVMSLLRILWKADGLKVSKISSENEFKNWFQNYIYFLKLEPSYRIDQFKELLYSLLIFAEESSKKQNAFLNIINNKKFHFEFSSIGWEVPANGFSNWKELISGIPESAETVEIILELSKNPDFLGIWKLLAQGLNYKVNPNIQDPRVLSFKDLSELKKLIWRLKNTQDLEFFKVSLIDIQNGKAPTNSFQHLWRIMTPEEIIDFWDRLFLKDQFLKMFSETKNFMSSDKSILDIYQQLNNLKK